MNLMVFNFLSIIHYSITLPHRRVVLLCAEKRGRFIPCRGGGTDTTYYTDSHDVDDDIRTIMDQGGESGLYWGGTTIGVFMRVMDNPPTEAWNNVASRLIYLS